MKRMFIGPAFLFCVVLMLTSVNPLYLWAQQKIASGIIKPNYSKLIESADLHYVKPVNRSEEGQPVGNGRMGSLVWTIPSSLKFQINRVDVFANNSASNNFFERHTDYCGGTGFVDIDFLEDVFSGKDFQQHLSCYDALETIQGKNIEAKVFAWNEEDVMVINVIDKRANAAPVNTNLRTLRAPLTLKGNHSAISKVSTDGDRIILTQSFKEDDYYCGSALVIGISGRRARTELTNESTARLIALPDDASFTIYVASAASFDPKEDLVSAAKKKLEAAMQKGYTAMLEANKNWWHQFWQKAFVHLTSADRQADFVEKNYNYYLYVMASSSRGDYPTKFNGMLWTTGGDPRKWGALYWGANQSCLYNSLLPTNRMELMDPMFKMYTGAFDDYAMAAVQQWGSKGIFIPEVTGFDGTPVLPDNIADEMKDLYLARKPWTQRSQDFIEYSYTKLPFLTRWNWKKDDGWKNGRWYSSDKGGGAFGHVTHIFSRGAKIAYQYWLKYEYTQDISWLRSNAYPMLKGVAEFYRNFPNIKKEKDGKYHIYHVNDNESVWDGHNTVEEISSMMGIFPAAIKAAEILNVDADLRSQWKEFIESLSPLAVSPDSINQKRSKPPTWIRSLPPILQGNGNRVPDGNTMPVWFFDLCTLESDPAIQAIGNATYNTYFPNGINDSTKVYVLSKLPVTGVLLGRAEATKHLIPNQIRTAETEVMSNRMDMREGFQTTSVQRLGRAAEALHYALVQSIPAGPGKEAVIRVFPAWPKDWDAQFTLLCRGNFLVTSSTKKGKIEFVEIVSQAGSTCRLRNPWKNNAVTIYRNGKKDKNIKTDLLHFSTKKNDHFVIVPRGTDFAALKQDMASN